MKLGFSAVFCVAVFLTGVACAADAPPASDPQIKVHINPALEQLDAPYKKAIEGLSEEQVKKLKVLEEEYNRGVKDLAAIPIAIAQLKICGKDDPETAQHLAKYQSETGVLINQIKAFLLPFQLKHEQKRATEAAFMDQDILNDHYEYNEDITISVGAQMTEQMMNLAKKDAKKDSKIPELDCAAFRQKLDDTFETASKPLSEIAGEVSDKVLKEVVDGAAAGRPESMSTLGTLYLTGNGVPKDVQKGVDFLTQAANKGYARAQYLLGLHYGTALYGGTVDAAKSKEWLGKAAAQGDKKAEMMLKNFDKQPKPETLEEIRKKAEAGDAAAEYDLAGRYVHGVGVDRDISVAQKWYLLSAGHGYPLAESDLGLLLFNSGRPTQGVSWMTRAARSGVESSQLELGNFYAGEGVKNFVRAKYWLKQAALTGDPRAVEALKKLETPPPPAK